MTENPLVSIVTPIWNGSEFVASLVRSSKRQTLSNFEHLIVDDGSTDGTPSRIRDATGDDGRYQVIENSDRAGPAVCRNIAIARARGRFLAFLDADDEWLPRKLELQSSFMQRTGGLFSFHSYRHMSDDGKRLGAIIHPPRTIRLPDMYRCRTIGCLTVMIDRASCPWFEFPVSRGEFPEDLLAWISVLKRVEQGMGIQDDLARYRLARHGRSARKIGASRAVWRCYREVEGLGLVRAVAEFMRYGVATTLKHIRSLPRFDRLTLDGKL